MKLEGWAMNMKQLGLRATACKRWKWMPGMLLQWKPENGSHYRGRVCDTWSFKDDGDLYCEGHEDRFTREELKAAWPDLNDPATLGCLLALVRAAWEEEDMGAFRYDEKRWCVEYTLGQNQHRAFYGATEAEALVAALEAAT